MLGLHSILDMQGDLTAVNIDPDLLSATNALPTGVAGPARLAIAQAARKTAQALPVSTIKATATGGASGVIPVTVVGGPQILSSFAVPAPVQAVSEKTGIDSLILLGGLGVVGLIVGAKILGGR